MARISLRRTHFMLNACTSSDLRLNGCNSNLYRWYVRSDVVRLALWNTSQSNPSPLPNTLETPDWTIMSVSTLADKAGSRPYIARWQCWKDARFRSWKDDHLLTCHLAEWGRTQSPLGKLITRDLDGQLLMLVLFSLPWARQTTSQSMVDWMDSLRDYEWSKGLSPTR